MDVVGAGELVSGKSTTGVARRVETIDDVLDLMNDPELNGVILLTDSASATAIMPLLDEVRGVICSVGGRTSHLATVTRELGLACVVAATFTTGGVVDGRRITIADDGRVLGGDG